MSALVYLPLLVPVLAAAAARPLAARLEPRLATWLLTATTVALAAFSTAALALMAASALARVPVLATLGDYSQPVLRRGHPGQGRDRVTAAEHRLGVVAQRGQDRSPGERRGGHQGQRGRAERGERDRGRGQQPGR